MKSGSALVALAILLSTVACAPGVVATSGYGNTDGEQARSLHSQALPSDLPTPQDDCAQGSTDTIEQNCEASESKPEALATSWMFQPDRQRVVAYSWGDWTLIEHRDRQRDVSHVRIEYKNVLQFIGVGTGWDSQFLDSSHFTDPWCDRENPEPKYGVPTWLTDGRPSHLAVEDLTGTGGVTVILFEGTGGNHVAHTFSIIHLGTTGTFRRFGPFGVPGDGPNLVSERVGDEVVFRTPDRSWQGWKGSMACSPWPEIVLSFAGGEVRTRNEPLSQDIITTMINTCRNSASGVERCAISGKVYGDHSTRNLVLMLIYRGHIEEARALVREWDRPLSHLYRDVDEFCKEGWWADMVATFKRSSYFRFLAREHPQLLELSPSLYD